MIRAFLAFIALIFSVVCSFVGGAEAAEIKALISTAMKTSVEVLKPQFEQKTGHTVTIDYGPSGNLTRRIAAGEAVDLAILGGEGVVDLTIRGKLAPDSALVLASSMIGAAVPRGAPKPDISTEEKFRAVLEQAKSVAYTDGSLGGSSGIYLGRLFDKLGMTAMLKPKAKLAAGGANGYAGTFVAKGEAEIALQPIPELMAVPGIDIVGPLPGQFQNATSYRGVVPIAAKEKEAAQAFLDFLRAPPATSVYRSRGLQASVRVLIDPGKPEINALITTAMKAAVDELLPRFERESGHKVNITYGPSGALAKKLAGGQAADLIILGSNELGDLAKQGKVTAAQTSIASTGIGVCVRKGAPKPDISNADALKRALLAAKTVAYVAPESGGVTGGHLVRLYEKLGIMSEIRAKQKLAAGGPNGRVSAIVASGDAEIGLQQISELQSNPDVDVVGLLPADLQQITTYTAGITANAKDTNGANALIKFLTTPVAVSVYKSKGLGF
ncbi:MAG: molybdate ABC transporter substrate-binding protein [Pseudomonadota bacterium]